MNPAKNDPSPPNAQRRALLYAGVGSAAAIAGAGLAWWKLRPAEAPDALSEEIWRQSFDTPAGSTLALQTLRGRPLLLNFWATWCAPCVDELPLLDDFYRQNAGNGWQVVGLAIDQPSAVRRFLERTPVSFPIGLAGLGGTEIGKALGNQVGGLPFSVVVGAAGAVLHRKMGRISAAELAEWKRLG
jgi:thiol-disulfide isomerase/thioredoxin